MKIVMASNNSHKITEIQEFFTHHSIDLQLLPLAEFPNAITAEETADSFLGNAQLKAQSIAQQTNLPALADDSGLCVDILDGAPGIYSARFAGLNADDQQNNHHLLKQLKPLNSTGPFKAHYACAMVLSYPDGSDINGYGITEGWIQTQKTGSNGFGYDPYFLSQDLNCTFGDADSKQKQRVSHRSRALEALLLSWPKY